MTAAINEKTGLWRVKSSAYLFSHKPLAKVFRANLLQASIDNKLSVPGDCPEQWVVDCKEVGNGDSAVLYLGNYLYQGVLKEKDILKCENGKVTLWGTLKNKLSRATLF